MKRKCNAEICLLKDKEFTEETAHVCKYCTRNEHAERPERDYSTAIKESGY